MFCCRIAQPISFHCSSEFEQFRQKELMRKEIQRNRIKCNEIRAKKSAPKTHVLWCAYINYVFYFVFVCVLCFYFKRRSTIAFAWTKHKNTLTSNRTRWKGKKKHASAKITIFTSLSVKALAQGTRQKPKHNKLVPAILDANWNVCGNEHQAWFCSRFFSTLEKDSISDLNRPNGRPKQFIHLLHSVGRFLYRSKWFSLL